MYAIRSYYAVGGRVPLHAARRFRDHGIERLVLDGERVRRLNGRNNFV